MAQETSKSPAPFTEQIKFYADTPSGCVNKLFCFECSIIYAELFLINRTLEGWSIRAAWHQIKDNSTGNCLENNKFKDLQKLKDKAHDIFDKYHIKHIKYNLESYSKYNIH
jgi:hypothetical protein